MGINKQTLSLILHENGYRKIEGKYLSIGKQTVNVDINKIKTLFHKNKLATEKLDQIITNQHYDKQTRHASDTILDHDLISSFSNAEYNCLDRSDYEGATVIHDMNNPVINDLKEKFDFIYNGSCMDNVFDPVMFIRNTTQLLKPGGRIIHLECASGFPGAFLMYSPEWFFSYYAINNFVDCKVYVTIGTEEGETVYSYDTDLYSWNPFFTRKVGYQYIEACKTVTGAMHVMIIAEKGKESTDHINPIQMQYLDDKEVDWRKMYYQYKKSKRPLIKLDQIKDPLKVTLPYLSDHYQYIGSGF